MRAIFRVTIELGVVVAAALSVLDRTSAEMTGAETRITRYRAVIDLLEAIPPEDVASIRAKSNLSEVTLADDAARIRAVVDLTAATLPGNTAIIRVKENLIEVAPTRDAKMFRAVDDLIDDTLVPEANSCRGESIIARVIDAASVVIERRRALMLFALTSGVLVETTVCARSDDARETLVGITVAVMRSAMLTDKDLTSGAAVIKRVEIAEENDRIVCATVCILSLIASTALFAGCVAACARSEIVMRKDFTGVLLTKER